MSENIEIGKEVNVEMKGVIWGESCNEDCVIIKEEKSGELVAVRKDSIVKKA